MQSATVKAALAAAKADEPLTLEDQIRFCEIPAPSFKEDVRGLELKRVFQELGLRNVRVDKGSTDSNLPMSLKIPAITIGGGGRGRDAHALTESFDTTDAWMGTQYGLLLAVALAQR
jgi:hypothetical protein